jgi:predicted DNA-binding transcriptional regulator AlpA
MTIQLLTEKEAAAALRISVRTLQRLGEDGRGPGRLRLTTKRIAYRATDIDAWIDNLSTHGKPN